MEKNYNTDDFEHFLRDTTDEFRMYPSRRVWHSLYNDLHPSRKWPSVTVLLLLIASLMYVGVTNPDQPLTVAVTSNDNSNKLIASINTPENTAISLPVEDVSNNVINGFSTSNTTNTTAINQTVSSEVVVSAGSDNLNQITETGSEKINERRSARRKSTSNGSTMTVTSGSVANSITRAGSDIENTFTKASNSDKNIAGSEMTDISISDNKINSTETSTISANDKSLTASVKPSGINNILKAKTDAKTDLFQKTVFNDIAWMENDVLHNKRPGSKFKNKITYQVYVTPSAGYRSLKKNTSYSAPEASDLLVNPYQANTIEYDMNHSGAINLEAGANAIYSINSRLRFKTGLQLNYTNYRINAYQLNHPTFTTLMLNDLDNGYPILESRTTTVANTPGPSTRNLNNNTYQISLPIGADYKIAGNNSIKWYAGASVQPTYVTGGHSYLISSDLKNYVDGESFMRNFNLNGAVETFVSYKTKHGVILSAGPQFRYQFLSTYNKQYTYDEKLYNLGVKLAMTAKF